MGRRELDLPRPRRLSRRPNAPYSRARRERVTRIRVTRVRDRRVGRPGPRASGPGGPSGPAPGRRRLRGCAPGIWPCRSSSAPAPCNPRAGPTARAASTGRRSHSAPRRSRRAPASPAWEPVTLPDRWRERRPGAGGFAWYRLEVPGPAAPGAEWAVYLPYVSMNAAAFVNGAPVGSGGRFSEPVARNFNRPLYFAFPSDLLDRPTNAIEIRLFAYPYLFGELAAPWIGPDRALRRPYEAALWQRATLAQGATVLCLVTVLFSGALWFGSRGDPVYGWLALVTALWSIVSFNYWLRDIPVSLWTWERTVHTSMDGFMLALACWAHRYVGVRRPRLERGLAAAAARVGRGRLARAGVALLSGGEPRPRRRLPGDRLRHVPRPAPRPAHPSARGGDLRPGSRRGARLRGSRPAAPVRRHPAGRPVPPALHRGAHAGLLRLDARAPLRLGAAERRVPEPRARAPRAREAPRARARATRRAARSSATSSSPKSASASCARCTTASAASWSRCSRSSRRMGARIRAWPSACARRSTTCAS